MHKAHLYFKDRNLYAMPCSVDLQYNPDIHESLFQSHQWGIKEPMVYLIVRHYCTSFSQYAFRNLLFSLPVIHANGGMKFHNPHCQMAGGNISVMQRSYSYQHLMHSYKWFLVHFTQRSGRKDFSFVSDVSSVVGLELFSLLCI